MRLQGPGLLPEAFKSPPIRPGRWDVPYAPVKPLATQRFVAHATLGLTLLIGLWFGLHGRRCFSQPPLPAPPTNFGLELATGPLVSGHGQCVSICDDTGQTIVARTHVIVGDRLVLLLPDGQLVVRSPEECSPTERPFIPATADAIAASLMSTGQNGFSMRQTRRYLYLYNSSEPFVEVASRILETMFRGVVTYAQSQNIEVHPPQVPLVVIVFRTQQQFRQYCHQPEGVVAYYDVVTNRVVMYEETPLWNVKPELAMRQSIATIAHEGAHQILHNIGVQQRLSHWPLWLTEGLAEFFAPTTTDRYIKWKGVGQVNDLRMFELEQYLKSRSADQANGQLVAQTVSAARLTSTGYAAAWALTHYLAKYRREEFNKLVREASQLGPLEGETQAVPPGVIPGNVRQFKAHFGENLADIERRLILYLQQLPYTDPFADWPHFVAMATDLQPNKRQANIFHRKDQAERWLEDYVKQWPANQRPGVRTLIREFPNRAVAEQFARAWLSGD